MSRAYIAWQTFLDNIFADFLDEVLAKVIPISCRHWWCFVTARSSTRNVILIKLLTIPSEENTGNTNIKKKCKYQGLVAKYENRECTVYYFPIDVGSKEIYNTSFSKFYPPWKYLVGEKKKTVINTAFKKPLEQECSVNLNQDFKKKYSYSKGIQKWNFRLPIWHLNITIKLNGINLCAKPNKRFVKISVTLIEC